MKVKEFISMLSKLDQEKEIKVVVASGYEYEEETSSEIMAFPYKDTAFTASGKTYFQVDDYNSQDVDKDFYLLSGKKYMEL